MRDFSSFDMMLVHLKLQTCFVLSFAIQSFRKFHYDWTNSNLSFYRYYNFIQHCTIIMPAEFSIKIITYICMFISKYLKHSYSFAYVCITNWCRKVSWFIMEHIVCIYTHSRKFMYLIFHFRAGSVVVFIQNNKCVWNIDILKKKEK